MVSEVYIRICYLIPNKDLVKNDAACRDFQLKTMRRHSIKVSVGSHKCHFSDVSDESAVKTTKIRQLNWITAFITCWKVGLLTNYVGILFRVKSNWELIIYVIGNWKLYDVCSGWIYAGLSPACKIRKDTLYVCVVVVLYFWINKCSFESLHYYKLQNLHNNILTLFKCLGWIYPRLDCMTGNGSLFKNWDKASQSI